MKLLPTLLLIPMLAQAAPAADAPAPVALPAAASPAVQAVAVAFDDPTAISVGHWNRILDGALYAASSRVDWAVLLQRTYGVDAMRSMRRAMRATVDEVGATAAAVAPRSVKLRARQ